jgi:hypothetical protein
MISDMINPSRIKSVEKLDVSDFSCTEIKFTPSLTALYKKECAELSN